MDSTFEHHTGQRQLKGRITGRTHVRTRLCQKNPKFSLAIRASTHVALGENPAEERELDHKAISVKELCQRYIEDAKAGLILGKKCRPKNESTIYTDEGRIKRQFVPLLGTRWVKDLTSADITRFMPELLPVGRR
ncbi:hypothetical protein SIAM614_02496 [Stappia aggregata IAM 12614]|uniref:Uncharacterized protein n=1 Tax=Roseibium aggregatum (strain ATCC 25650 / DSM 13394 / JCM 20685 / NBRC 16684 / NCIMB 2208 / IAM 12614 / B1) TaxID=384765 RepID=A0NUA8_ROSAI|nr:hypothetical protein [Roseibium aggregatum]EAV43510.1 hypothetical protein SIAM614_02496 [Stappia aggregata IAM 12614] [Roseibium aggregatum IAM 12614]